MLKSWCLKKNDYIFAIRKLFYYIKKMNITINTSELLKVLEETPSNQNIMLVGKHGIGKSQILTKFYESQGIRVVTLFLGQMSDPGDIIGLPNKDESTGQTVFALPYWFPVDNNPIVLFLDELNRARPEILQTVMDLALNRKLAGKGLPSGSRIISAVNIGEEYQLTDLDPALVSRFNIYDFRPTTSEWLTWAHTQEIDDRVIGYIGENEMSLDGDAFKGEINGLDKTPDRRAWEKVSSFLKNKKDISNIDIKIISGMIGNKTAVDFLSYLTKNKTISPLQLVNDYDKYRDEVIRYTPHEKSILNSALCSLIESEKSKENSFEKFRDFNTGINNITKYIEDLYDMDKESLGHLTDEIMNFSLVPGFLVKNAPVAWKIINNYVVKVNID